MSRSVTGSSPCLIRLKMSGPSRRELAMSMSSRRASCDDSRSSYFRFAACVLVSPISAWKIHSTPLDIHAAHGRKPSHCPTHQHVLTCSPRVDFDLTLILRRRHNSQAILICCRLTFRTCWPDPDGPVGDGTSPEADILNVAEPSYKPAGAVCSLSDRRHAGTAKVLHLQSCVPWAQRTVQIVD